MANCHAAPMPAGTTRNKKPELAPTRPDFPALGNSYECCKTADPNAIDERVARSATPNSASTETYAENIH